MKKITFWNLTDMLNKWAVEIWEELNEKLKGFAIQQN